MTTTLPTLPEKLDYSVLDGLISTPVPSAREIDISFFSHRNRKSTQLVGNHFEKNFVKARREWMDFDFTELIYVTSLTVCADGYEEYHELELSYQDFLSGTTKTVSSKYDGDAFHFKLDCFIGGFGLKPSERWFKDSKLTSIKVEGVEQRSFSDVISILTKLNSEIESIQSGLSKYLEQAKTSEIERLKTIELIAQSESELAENNEIVEQLGDKINARSVELDALIKEIAVNESVKRSIASQAQEIRNNLEKMQAHSGQLAKDVQEKETRLRNLQNDINLFPTEISGYVTQGAKNVSLYAFLCAIPLIVVVSLTIRLLMNSEKILSYDLSGAIGILDFLISRFPYVFISFAVLAVCYTVLNRLITEIIGINRRRQDLFKISIIATDVSYASQEGLDITDEDSYNLRTQTKMELLKEHLRQHIGEEFIYNPKRHFIQRVTGLFSKHLEEDGLDTSGATKAEVVNTKA